MTDASKLSKPQAEALRILLMFGACRVSRWTRCPNIVPRGHTRSVTVDDVENYAGSSVTISHGAYAALHKKRFARRIFKSQVPSIWEIIHPPTVIEITDAGRHAYAEWHANGR